MQEKKYTSFYLTGEMAASLDNISRITDIPKARIINRAIRDFIGRKIQRIEPALLITKKTDPMYIQRDHLMGCNLDPDCYDGLKRAAEEHQCSMAVIISQSLVDWETAMRFRGGQ